MFTKQRIVFALFCTFLAFNTYGQELSKKQIRKQNREIKRSLKKLYKNIKKDPQLRESFYETIKTCDEMDTQCQDRLERIAQDAAQGTGIENQASGLTFGICHLGADSHNVHRVVYSKKNYDCKLSSNGLVYDLSIQRKLFGPGLIWDKQSIVLMCTGPAYGTSVYGSTLTVGVGFGISLGSLFGKPGLCLAVGAGKSVGFFIGGEKVVFEDLSDEVTEKLKEVEQD